MDTLKAQIAGRNDGMLSTYRSSNQSFKVMVEYKVRIEGNTVTRGWRADVHHSPPPFCQEGARLLSRAGHRRLNISEKRRLRKQRGKSLLSGNSSVLRQRASLSGKTPVKQKSHDVGLE